MNTQTLGIPSTVRIADDHLIPAIPSADIVAYRTDGFLARRRVGEVEEKLRFGFTPGKSGSAGRVGRRWIFSSRRRERLAHPCRRRTLASAFRSRLKMGSVCTQSWRHLRLAVNSASGFAGQRIDHPILLPLGGHHFALAQVGEVLGNFHLRFVQDFLEMTDAERRLSEQDEGSAAAWDRRSTGRFG